jgi:hypothetical protein
MIFFYVSSSSFLCRLENGNKKKYSNVQHFLLLMLGIRHMGHGVLQGEAGENAWGAAV